MKKSERIQKFKRVAKKNIKEDRSKDTKEAQENFKRAFRQTAIVMDQEKTNNFAITCGQFRDMEQGKWKDSVSEGPVKDSRKEPVWIRILSIISGLAIIIGFIMTVASELSHLGLQSEEGVATITIVSAGILTVGIVAYICIRAIVAYRDRQRWLRVVREQDAEKFQSTATQNM